MTCPAESKRWTNAVEPGQKSPTCGYAYEKPSLPKGNYTITAVTTWNVTWTVNNQSGVILFRPSRPPNFPSESSKCSSDNRTSGTTAFCPQKKGKAMSPKQIAAAIVGMLVFLKDPRNRDERGLSQSAETAILIAGAVTVALVVVGLVTAYVRTKMAQIYRAHQVSRRARPQ